MKSREDVEKFLFGAGMALVALGVDQSEEEWRRKAALRSAAAIAAWIIEEKEYPDFEFGADLGEKCIALNAQFMKHVGEAKNEKV